MNHLSTLQDDILNSVSREVALRTKRRIGSQPVKIALSLEITGANGATVAFEADSDILSAMNPSVLISLLLSAASGNALQK